MRVRLCWSCVVSAGCRARLFTLGNRSPPTGSAEPWAAPPSTRREEIAHLRTSLGINEWRACGIIGANRTSLRCRSKRGDDTALRVRLRELAQQRRRFGYRRLHNLLLRDGVTINRKKTQRLYTEEGLTVRKRKSRRRAVGARSTAAGDRAAERALVAALRA